jgi:hypothetical protein
VQSVLKGYVLICLALLGLSSCTSKKVAATGYTEIQVDGSIALRLPAQFQKIQHPAPTVRPAFSTAFLGDTAGLAEDQNFWAITHAFAFRETTKPGGGVEIPALLVVSRVADRQSFVSAQLFYESAARYSPDPRWSVSRRLSWKSQTLTKSITLFEAEIEAGKQGSSVFILLDRENLIEALILGDQTVLTAGTARRVLSDVRDGYRVAAPLEDYFHQINQAVQSHAEVRRKNYLALLDTLQKEELDYTPTPRVVVFNPNLAGQFWYPPFDRSGVPTHFAITGRLGKLLSGNANAWKKLEPFFPGMRFVAGQPEGNSVRWSPLGSPTPLSARTLSLMNDTRWADTPEQQAFATLEFSFASGIPDLSLWLNALEVAEKQAEAQGLVITTSIL